MSTLFNRYKNISYLANHMGLGKMWIVNELIPSVKTNCSMGLYGEVLMPKGNINNTNNENMEKTINKKIKEFTKSEYSFEELLLNEKIIYKIYLDTDYDNDNLFLHFICRNKMRPMTPLFSHMSSYEIFEHNPQYLSMVNCINYIEFFEKNNNKRKLKIKN